MYSPQSVIAQLERTHTPASSRKPLQGILYMPAPRPLGAVSAAEFMAEHVATLYPLPDDAVEAARRIGPESDWPEERKTLIEQAHEEQIGDIDIARFMPEHVAYVAELLFPALRITRTTSTDERVHKTIGRSSLDIDAVVLPCDDPPHYALQVVTTESLFGRFEFRGLIRVYDEPRHRTP